MKTFLYIRGNPGTGKITVARKLREQLGWRLFWFHDLKNAVYNIVQEHRIPRLMDEITVPVVRFLLEKGENIVYVRPSPERETVASIHKTVQAFPDYRFFVIRLTASYDTLHERIIQRDDPYRIHTKDALDEYVNGRTVVDIDGEHCIATDGISPDDVVQKILQIVQT